MPSAPESPISPEIQVWRIELGPGEGREAARGALGWILAGLLGEAAPPRLALYPQGKPHLAAEPGRLAFNLSHSGGLALVAIAPGGIEVGVDVERVKERRDLPRLAARWLPPADAAAVLAAAPGEERERIFYAAWTRHEARAKCTGAGLSGPPPGPEVVARQLEIDGGYAAAVAVHDPAAPGRAPRIVLRDAACRR